MLETARDRLARLIAPTSQVVEGKGVSLGFDFTSQGMGTVTYLGNTVPGDVSSVSAKTAFATAAMCHAAIRYRADNVSEPPLVVMEGDDQEGWEPVDGHPLNAMLEQPSLDYDMGETLWLTQASLDIDGRSIWVKDAANLGPTPGALMQFPGCDYTVEQTAERIFGLYRLRTAGGERKLAPEDVVAFRYLDPHSRHESTSPTDVALSWLNLGQSVKTAVRSMMRNGMFPSAVLSPDKDWRPSADEYQRFKAALEQYHSQPQNAGKPFVAMGGTKVTRLAFSLKDMLPDEMLDRIEATVAMVYGVAPVVLGALVGLKNSPWSQMSEARRSTYEDTIAPLWRRHEKALTSQLLRPLDAHPRRRIRFDTSGVRALQRDQTADIANAQEATVWTLDERRLHAGQEALDDEERGGWIEAIDGVSAPAPLPEDVEVDPDDDDDDDGDPKSYDPLAPGIQWAKFDLQAKSVEDDLRKVAQEQLADDARALAGAVSLDPAFRVAHAEHFKSRVLLLPDPELGGWAAKQSEELTALLWELTDIGEDWAAEMTPLVGKVSRGAARDVARTHRLSFDVVTPGLDAFAERHTVQLAGRVSKTTRENLGREIRDSLKAGESIETLAARIEDSAGFSSARAELIARTESTAIVNGAQRQTMSDVQTETGDVVEKGWLSARDKDVRKVHAELDAATAKSGDYIGVDEPYSNGLTEPGEPNCRCTNIYRIRSPE